MKRLISLIVIMTIICVSTLTFATAPTFNIELVPSKTEAKQAEEIEVIMKVTNLTGGTVYGYIAKLEYDTTVFETITSDEDLVSDSILGLNSWDQPNYNPNSTEDSNIISAYTNGIKEDKEIAKIKLKVKSDAVIGKEAKIKMTNIKVSAKGDGDIEDISVPDAETTIKIVNASQSNQGTSSQGTSSQGTGSQGTSSQGTSSQGTGSQGTGSQGTGSQGTSNQGTGSQATGKLPQTGENEMILLISGILIVGIGIVSFIKYKSAY